MKIAVISDIHGNMPALKAVLSEIGDMQIYCAGDFIGGCDKPNEVIEFARKKEFNCVMGDMEYFLEYPYSSYLESLEDEETCLTENNYDWLLHLPLTVAVGRVLMVHASPDDPFGKYVFEEDNEIEKFLKESSYTGVIHGHTHKQYLKKTKYGFILNPGSVGFPKDENTSSYAIWDLETNEIQLKRTDYEVFPLK